jgi:chemosensory pili system protein ChpA (sensor histidine kinase/response regulator)
MDVVAEAVERMRSWIEVESSPGEGTKIRLSIPLQSVIEHTMVFRCGGQLFAVPMQYVRAAGEGVEDSARAGKLATVACNDLIRPAQAGLEGPQQRLVIGFGKKVSADSAAGSSKYAQSGQQLSVLVDDILGPEEVVARPLPPLLRHQSLVSGVTLSGTGELLLLLDSQQLIERGLNLAGDSPASVKSSKPLANAPLSRVLVVDDSISARRALTRPLKHFGLETIEASDGIEALELLREGGFAAVFSDLEMPRAGGLDLLREVSSFDHSSRVPVIIISSRDEDEYKQQAKDLGAVAYLTKPAPESRVADELRRLGLLPTTRSEGEVH